MGFMILMIGWYEGELEELEVRGGMKIKAKLGISVE
jgi:hypothetical protein